MALTLGQPVSYTDTKGHSKFAIVTGTPETVVEGSDLPTLNPDHYAITVFSPSGRIYPKFSVPDVTADDINLSEYASEEDGSLVGVIVAL